MPNSTPDQRRPHSAAKEGVKIVSSKPDGGGVKRYSKHEGGSHEAQAESRVVGHDEMKQTKKLTDERGHE